jgi:hypothetical protein
MTLNPLVPFYRMIDILQPKLKEQNLLP